MEFKKSSFCGVGACVQIKVGGDEITVRHSKKPEVILRFSKKEWRAFIAGVKNGEFDFQKIGGN